MMHFLPEYNLVLAGSNDSLYTDKLTALVISYGMENQVFQLRKDRRSRQSSIIFKIVMPLYFLPCEKASEFLLSRRCVLANRYLFQTTLPYLKLEVNIAFTGIITNLNIWPIPLNWEWLAFINAQEFYENWYVARAKSFNWDNTAKQYLEVYKNLLEI